VVFGKRFETYRQKDEQILPASFLYFDLKLTKLITLLQISSIGGTMPLQF